MYFDFCEVAPLMTNCYLIGDETVCAVVDPGGSPERVLAMVEKSGLQPVMILVTHGHYDHVRGIPGLLEKYPDLPIYIHEKELCEAEAWSKRFWLPHQGANQRTYAEGDTLALGTLTVKVMETPGHSAGSVVLLVEDFMFSGDTIFALSCGRCDLPGGSEDAPAIWLNGPCADLSTRFTRRESSHAEVQRMGNLLKDALERVRLQPVSDFCKAIRVCEQELELPYGSVLRGEARQALLRQLLEQAEACTDPAARRELDSCIAVLRREERDLPDTRTVTVAACDLGALLLLALPFEVSWQDGLRLEQEASRLCRKPALLVCYCGGYDGYLPHENAGISYQDLATGFLPQAREIIWQNTLKCVENTQL